MAVHLWLPDVQGEYINNVQNVVCSYSDVSTLWNFSSWIWPTEPCTQIPWIDSTAQSKAFCSVAAKGKIKEYGIGALLLPSSSQQNHELMIDHISIMKLPAFWCIRQDQCLNLPGLAKWLQKLSRDVCSYPKTGSVCRDRVTVHKKHHSRGVKTVSYWSLVLH